jgi:hypothetical protein
MHVMKQWVVVRWNIYLGLYYVGPFRDSATAAAWADDFKETIDTILHENMHHYQDELVKMLHEGSLKSSDPRYDQALMFEVNKLDPGGYIEPKEGDADYRAQPVERSAYETGTATVGKVIDAIH